MTDLEKTLLHAIDSLGARVGLVDARDKVPILRLYPSGCSSFIRDRQTIIEHARAFPESLMAVNIGSMGEDQGGNVIDLDIHFDDAGNVTKDGPAVLKQSGLKLPKDTLRYRHADLGHWRHTWMRRQPGGYLGPSTNLRLDAEDRRLHGVDRKAGNQLVVYRGDYEQIAEWTYDDLALAPDWASYQHPVTTGNGFDRGLQDWLELNDRAPTERTQQFMASWPDLFGYEDMLKKLDSLVEASANEGMPGASLLIEEVRSRRYRYLDNENRHTRTSETDFDRALNGSIERKGGKRPDPLEGYYERIAERSKEKKAKAEKPKKKGMSDAKPSPAEIRAEDEEAKGPKRLSITSLMEEDFPEQDWVVPDLIAEGTSILSAAPKIGKSLFALEVALCASAGLPTLGGLPTTAPRPVLYLDLESGPRRLQKRIRALGITPGTMEYHLDPATARDEFLRFMLDHAGERPFIVVDTLAAIMEDKPKEKGLLAHEHGQLSLFQRATAADPGSAVLIVHHANKGSHADQLGSVSGSNGITGGVDSPMILTRERKEKRGLLHCIPRDWEGGEYAFDFIDGRWSIAGGSLEAAQAQAEVAYEQKDIAKLGPVKQALLDIVSDAGKEGIDTAGIKRQYVGRAGEDANLSRLHQNLSELAVSRRIFRLDTGVYVRDEPGPVYLP